MISIPGRQLDREAFKRLLRGCGPSARFLVGFRGAEGKPGPIQTARNDRIDASIIDPKGTIRSRHIVVTGLLESGIAAPLEGPRGRERTRARKGMKGALTGPPSLEVEVELRMLRINIGRELRAVPLGVLLGCEFPAGRACRGVILLGVSGFARQARCGNR